MQLQHKVRRAGEVCRRDPAQGGLQLQVGCALWDRGSACPPAPAPALPPPTPLASSSYRKVQGHQNINTRAARDTHLRNTTRGSLQQVIESSSKKYKRASQLSLRQTENATGTTSTQKNCWNTPHDMKQAWDICQEGTQWTLCPSGLTERHTVSPSQETS